MSNIKLCAFADEANAEIDVQIAALKRNSIPYLEIRNVDGDNISKITLEKAKEVKSKLDANGLAVWSLGSPYGKIKITDDFAPHLDDFKYGLELSHKLGAKCIRLFSFYEATEPAARDIVMERLSAFIEAAKGSGIATKTKKAFTAMWLHIALIFTKLCPNLNVFLTPLTLFKVIKTPKRLGNYYIATFIICTLKMPCLMAK